MYRQQDGQSDAETDDVAHSGQEPDCAGRVIRNITHRRRHRDSGRRNVPRPGARWHRPDRARGEPHGIGEITRCGERLGRGGRAARGVGGAQQGDAPGRAQRSRQPQGPSGRGRHHAYPAQRDSGGVSRECEQEQCDDQRECGGAAPARPAVDGHTMSIAHGLARWSDYARLSSGRRQAGANLRQFCCVVRDADDSVIEPQRSRRGLNEVARRRFKPAARFSCARRQAPCQFPWRPMAAPAPFPAPPSRALRPVAPRSRPHNFVG